MHLLETIGNTPLIELRNTTASTEGRLPVSCTLLTLQTILLV